MIGLARCLSKFSLVPGEPERNNRGDISGTRNQESWKRGCCRASFHNNVSAAHEQTENSRLATLSYCSLVLQHTGSVVKGRGWFVISVDIFEAKRDLNTVKHVQEHVSVGISFHIVQYW